MRFNPNANLDTSQIEDQRGGGGGMPGGKIALGGGAGLVILLLSLLFGVNPGDLAGYTGSQSNQQSYEGPSLAEECRTGSDANAHEECRVVGFVNSIQAYWTDAFAQRGQRYAPAKTTFFTDAVQTGCGTATSEVGPFYCPEDRQVYIDLGFYDELRQKFGAKGGPLAEAYVLAHEYGHHVQHIKGIMQDHPGNGNGPASNGVRTELQADCFAGAWIGQMTQQTDKNGVPFLQAPTPQQIADALNAAQAVGDDHIQKEAGQPVNPESWTHGSSAQRERWFENGYQKGPNACDTFRVSGGSL
jgi:predicted metalloprotease